MRLWAAATLLLLAVGSLSGCDNKGKDQALQLTDWLRVSKTATGSQAAGTPSLHYAIRKPQRFWFIAYDDWQTLDYDLVNVIDDKNILIAKSSQYAKTQAQAAQDSKAADTQVRLMSTYGETNIPLCPSSDMINAPPGSNFVDCLEISKLNRLTVKRVDFHGKLLQTVSMAANEWDDLTTQKNVAYYDEQQQAYILEIGKDNTYCRLIMPGKEKNLSFALNLTTTQGKCSDMASWSTITQKKLSKSLAFGELGKNASLWKKLEASHPGWKPVRLVASDLKQQTPPEK